MKWEGENVRKMVLLDRSGLRNASDSGRNSGPSRKGMNRQDRAGAGKETYGKVWERMQNGLNR